ncbi:MAG: anhydro-N-acetylmuramic acid kinase [Saprospiraceae bacterium]
MKNSLEAKIILGMMSGTSLDGIDLAACSFNTDIERKKVSYQILKAETIAYSTEWKNKLDRAFHNNVVELQQLDRDYGAYIAQVVNEFKQRHALEICLIGSHGHTVFHQPEKGFSLQIGDGSLISQYTQITTVSNFRNQDIKLEGQGAPLVPIGDELLFSEFDFCINLGGFSNISWRENGIRKACDICPCNILLNYLAQKKQLNYDLDGKIASTGKINKTLLKVWNNLDFYQKKEPKSLGREWCEQNFFKDFEETDTNVEDLMRTTVEHIAFQISRWVKIKSIGTQQKILITGGGTHNTYLLNRIKNLLGQEFSIPNVQEQIIDYKEALIFAYLAYLRMKGENNTLSSVTGSLQDHSSGDVNYI